jgi:ComF family protein
MIGPGSPRSIETPAAGCQPTMQSQVDRLLDRLGGWLLPPRCVLCGGRGTTDRLDLCSHCELALPVATMPVRNGPAPLRLSCTPWEYAHPLDHLVHLLKYRGQLAAGRVLGSLLARRIRALGLDGVVDGLLVPVPLHPARHARRGFNQSAEVARWVAAHLGRPLAPELVERVRDTPPQVGLHVGERRANVRGAFRVAADVAGRHVIVVDDVTTTGSTLRELAEVLLAAGAVHVDAWCVARADRQVVEAASAAAGSPAEDAMR